MYQQYVSLGENCECAFQFRRVLGRDQSSFFSWNVVPFDSLIALVENRFEGVCEPSNFVRQWDGTMIADTKYHYLFHSMFPSDAGSDFSAYPDIVAEHQTKASYLIEKFTDQCRSSDRVAMFYKTGHPQAREKAEKLSDRIDELVPNGKHYKLIIVLPEEMREPAWDHPRLANRYLRRFAPENDATDAHVGSWDRIFAEFPHSDGLRLAGYL